MNKLKQVYHLVNNMGVRYAFYRAQHELEKRLGILKRKHPANLNLAQKVEQRYFGRTNIFHYERLRDLKLSDTEKLVENVERILGGELQFFNSSWINLGNEYDWITNPINGYKYDITKHWSEIPDLSLEAGDIKYVWEKSRFSWLLPILRYDSLYKHDLSEYVFSEIESWIKSNPINYGPNWRCSQEISLRMFNWYFALSYYKDSAAFTEDRWAMIQDVIYASLHHVYNHIDFSRIAVRNNHAITETLFLALSNILFPFIPHTKKWAKDGRRWFEEEVAYQIYGDGTFLQFSMNYHRVVVQLLTLGLSIAEKANQPFSSTVYDRAYKSIEFLYQCLQEENGWLPNYGSNDGALFFPWSDTDYRDYRSQLNSLHYFLTGKHLFEKDKLKEEISWYEIIPSSVSNYKKIKKYYGIKEYPIGGYVIIRDINSFTFIRCGTHQDRPAQADNLHLDIWIKGKNVLRDSGTYKYNTSEDLGNYFMGTCSHNSVIVNNESQMLKGSRFIWYYWTQNMYSKIQDHKEYFSFDGAIFAFQQLSKKGIHRRMVKKIKDVNKWEICDIVEGLDKFNKKQIWHFNGDQIKITAREGKEDLESKKVTSYISDYYGVMEEGTAKAFPFKKSINTTIEIDS